MRRIEVMKMAMPALREGERRDAVDILERAVRAYEVAIEGPRNEEAQKIRQRLVDGADFAETAKAFSEGSRAADGGEFPWMQPKDVRPELQETLLSLPAGELSEIIKTDQQLYLVKLEARRQAGYKSFEEVRTDVKNMLTAKERERLKSRWIDRLEEENYIVIYD